MGGQLGGLGKLVPGVAHCRLPGLRHHAHGITHCGVVTVRLLLTARYGVVTVRLLLTARYGVVSPWQLLTARYGVVSLGGLLVVALLGVLLPGMPVVLIQTFVGGVKDRLALCRGTPVDQVDIAVVGAGVVVLLML